MRRTCGAAFLLALIAIAGCRARSGAPATRAASSASASSTPAPPWLADANRIYKSALTHTAPARLPFGRIRSKLTSFTIVDANPTFEECPEGERRCARESYLYVRVERTDGGLSVMPQCSVLEGRPRSGIRHAPRSLDGRLGGTRRRPHRQAARPRQCFLDLDRRAIERPGPPAAPGAGRLGLYSLTRRRSREDLRDRARRRPGNVRPSGRLSSPCAGRFLLHPRQPSRISDGSRAPTQHERGAQFGE